MASDPRRRRRGLTHESRVFVLALLAGTAGSATAILLLWFGDYDSKVRWTLTLFVVFCWLSFAFATRERVIRPLQTISNMLAALREGDFSTRARARATAMRSASRSSRSTCSRRRCAHSG